MKKYLVGLASVAMLIAPIALSAPASAVTDSPGCVTRAEYRTVKKGMPRAKVHRIFDTDGKRSVISRSGGYVFEVRTYKVCKSPYSVISVGFDKKPGGVLRLSNKTAVFVN